MPSIPIKHNTCLEQPWQETTAADVWLRPLWFSPKPPDPPSKSTSTDCWAFAWDWLWATFPPCWPLLAAWGSDWSHFLNWSRSKWYCLWTSSSFLCSFFTSDHQCIQRERESRPTGSSAVLILLQTLHQWTICCACLCTLWWCSLLGRWRSLAIWQRTRNTSARASCGFDAQLLAKHTVRWVRYWNGSDSAKQNTIDKHPA